MDFGGENSEQRHGLCAERLDGKCSLHPSLNQLIGDDVCLSFRTLICSAHHEPSKPDEGWTSQQPTQVHTHTQLSSLHTFTLIFLS